MLIFEYHYLLSHSKTRWLSLFPGINRLIEMFPALKAYFLSIEKPPMVLKAFFENELSELYLLHLQSFVSTFDAEVNATKDPEDELTLQEKLLIRNAVEKIRWLAKGTRPELMLDQAETNTK